MLDSYNTKELKTYEVKEKLMDKSADDLRDLCRENDLKVSGSKDELAERIIAEGEEADTESDTPTRTYTFTDDGETVEADNYQDALDKRNS